MKPSTMTKACIKCGLIDRYPDGKCKFCTTIQRRLARERDPVKYQTDRARWLANQDSVRRLENKRRWTAANPDRIRGYALKASYGINLEEYQRMLEEQDGRCKICGTLDPGGKGEFPVDHCHETGQIRGLLCTQCNLGGGMFEHNPERLRLAADYFERFIP